MGRRATEAVPQARRLRTVAPNAPILVVDDDPGVRALLADSFARAGFATVQAGAGEDALAAAADGRPAAVVLDVGLPRMSGWEVCRALRERYGEQLPIVFLSGERIESIDRVCGLLLGGDDYVVKPVDPGELVARVRRAVERNGAAQASTHAPTASRSDRHELTPREREVLELLTRGLTQAQIARELVISTRTVGTHIQRILGKLGVHSRAQAVALELRERLVPNRDAALGSGSGA
jgi:DNA-binding NarL/FixJ family response regulator